MLYENEFKFMWSLDCSWGVFEKSNKKLTAKIFAGELNLDDLELPFVNGIKSIDIDGNKAEFGFKEGIVRFTETKKVTYTLEIERAEKFV